jgi:hypothetical protein
MVKLQTAHMHLRILRYVKTYTRYAKIDARYVKTFHRYVKTYTMCAKTDARYVRTFHRYVKTHTGM